MRLSVFVIVISLVLAGCGEFNQHAKYKRCAKYKVTVITLITYSQVFYPELPTSIRNGSASESDSIRLKSQGKENIFDYWGNNFQLSADKTFIYSLGENGIDDQATGDDIFVDNKYAFTFYCENKIDKLNN